MPNALQNITVQDNFLLFTDSKNEIPGAINEHRIRQLEKNQTIVISDPEIEPTTMPIGLPSHLISYCESYLNPKQRIALYVLTIPEIDIYEKEYIAEISGRVNIPITIPSHIPSDTILNVQLTARDYLGNQSRTIHHQIKVLTTSVRTPSLSFPTPNTVMYCDCDTGITITGSPFSTSDYAEEHTQSEFRITKDREGLQPVVRFNKIGAQTTHTFIDIDLEDGEYFAWVRYLGSVSGWSKWSSPILFQSVHVKIEKPVILHPEANTTIITKENPIVADCSVLNIIGCTDIPKNQIWKICSDVAGEDIIIQKAVRADSLTCVFNSEELNLEDGKDYYIFCQYTAEKYKESEWSDPVKFTEKSGVIKKPIILSPANNDQIKISVKGIPVVTKGYLCDFHTDNHILSEYKICSDIFGNSVIVHASVEGDSISHTFHRDTLSALVNNRVYYLFVRYKGESLGYSPWSDPVSFKAIVAHIKTPTLGNPVNNSYFLVNTSIFVSADYFGIQNALDYHKYTDWKITYDKDGENVFVENLNDKSHLNSYTFRDLELTNNTLYYVWVRYGSSEYGVSDWSYPIVIKAIDGLTRVCSIIEPIGNEVAVNVKGVAVMTNAYSCEGTFDEQSSADYKICSDIEGTNVLFQVLQSQDKYRHVFPVEEIIPTLRNNTRYYVFARHKGSFFPPTEWSKPQSFVAIYATLEKPSITSLKAGTVIYNTLNVVSSPLEVSLGTDIHTATNWKIIEMRMGETVFEETSTRNLTSNSFNTVDFPVGDYLVQCQYVSQNLGTTEWSDYIKFVRSKQITHENRKLYRHSSEKGTVIEFVDWSGNLQKFMLLDAKYRTTKEFGLCGININVETLATPLNSKNNYYVSGIVEDAASMRKYPNLSDTELAQLWKAKLQTTQSTVFINNTVKIIETADTRGIIGSSAINYCNDTFIDGMRCCLPNLEWVIRIMIEAQNFDLLDPTIKDFPTKALVNNPYGFWSVDGTDSVWSCTMSEFTDTLGVWCITKQGKIVNTNKQFLKAVLPVLPLN